MKKILVTLMLAVLLITGVGSFSNKDMATPDEPIHPPTNISSINEIIQ
ncbi:hypothetical protein [Paucisalibacillus globulus]|jgi:hypothetical protein|nr:hypothetical protein [Paucisalibacillus globulus]